MGLIQCSTIVWWIVICWFQSLTQYYVLFYFFMNCWQIELFIMLCLFCSNSNSKFSLNT
jgi:hypothetical protein